MTAKQSNVIYYETTKTIDNLLRTEELKEIIAFAYDEGFNGIKEENFEIQTNGTETAVVGKSTKTIYAKECSKTTSYKTNFNILKSSIELAHMTGYLKRANNKITEIEDTINLKTRNNK